MCGIVGLISKRSTGFYAKQADLMSNMLRIDSIRGMDSTGVFGVTSKGQVDWKKGDGDGYLFTNTINWAEFRRKMIRDYQIVIGHNRKATRGEISAENAHPFTQKHITLVHNGTVWNSKSIKDVDVDSEAIAYALADHNAPEALKKLNGAFALVWYDKKDKTLNLVRNKERPLCLIEYDDMWVVSSEANLALWLTGRENEIPVTNGVRSLPTDKILTFTLGALDKAPTELSYEEYKYYTPPAEVTVVAPIGATYNKPNSTQMSWPAQHRIRSRGLVTGDPFKFKLISYDDAVRGMGRCLLGHPIFGDEQDNNIWCEVIIPRDKNIEDYIGASDIFTATLMHTRNMGGRMVFFGQNPYPLSIIKSANGFEMTEEQTKSFFPTSCPRCCKFIQREDIGKSLVVMRKDKTLRVLCSSCLTDSLKNANTNKTLELPTNSHVH